MLRQRFCENLDDAPAVQAAFPSVFLSQNELLDATFPFLHDASGFCPDIGFQAPTTHGADNLAFRRDQHLAFSCLSSRSIAALKTSSITAPPSFLAPSQPSRTYYRSLTDQCKCA